MAQKAYIIEGISGDILEHEPIASQIAEGFQVSSINAFNKDGKSMCLVLLSDGESSGGGGSDSNYLAPPVFSPMAHLAYPYEGTDETLEVTLTAEEGTTILYALTDGYSPSSNEFGVYEEPIELTGGGDIFAFATKGTGQEIEVSPVVGARYILGGK